MFFDDDGNQINPALVPVPKLCLSCENKGDPDEEILCVLTRFDQGREKEFKCYAYRSIYGVLDNDIIEDAAES